MKGNVWEIVRREDGTFEIFHKGNCCTAQSQIGGLKISWDVMASAGKSTETSVGN
jgi:hypothetical protein